MANREETYQLIERYLLEEMAEAERQAFEENVRTDSVLASELALHREVSDSLAGEKIHAFRRVVRDVDAEWEAPATSEGRKFRLNPRWYAVAATVLVLVMAAGWWLTRPSGPDALYGQYFEPYRMALNQRSGMPDMAAIRVAAINAYESGQYREAIGFFSQMAQTDSLGMAPLFYQGVSYLALGEAEDAIISLRQIAESGDPVFEQQATWYVGLAFLQAEDIEKAVETLQAIQSGEYQYEKAQELLRQLH